MIYKMIRMIYQTIKRILPSCMKKKVYSCICRMYSLSGRYRLFKIFHREFFVHVSDLLYPHEYGLTAIQMVVISRLLDTKLWQMGKKPVWFLKFSQENEFVQVNCDKFCNQYIEFLKRIDETGFNPDMGALWCFRTPNFSFANGTHRLGWLLAVQPNVFVRIKIIPAFIISGNAENGMDFYKNHGVSEAEIDEIYICYKELWQNMRHSLSGYFYEVKSFMENRQQVLEAISK